MSLDNLANFYEKRFGKLLDLKINFLGENESYCSVLLCSTSTELNKVKVELALRLWDLQISTDISHEVVGSVFPVLVRFFYNFKG